MGILGSLKSDDSIANERDSVGGGGPLDSNAYKFNIALAYVVKAASDALGLFVSLKGDDGRELRQTFWMTSGKEKGCKNYYEKDGEKHYLPGYLLANSLALLTVGKEIGELDTEQKVVNVYNKEAKAETPTKVDMVMDLVGKDIVAGVIKQIVDKTKKNDATGQYEPTGETREENEVDKFFRARDNMTTAEIRAQAEAAAFYDTWVKKWAGNVKNRASKAGSNGTAGAPRAAAGAPAAAQGTKKPTQSLFA